MPTRVAIIAPNLETADDLADLLRDDDRFDLVQVSAWRPGLSIDSLSEVVLAFDVLADELPEDAAPLVLIEPQGSTFAEPHFSTGVSAILPAGSSPAEIAGALLAAASDLVVLTREQAIIWMSEAPRPKSADLIEPLTPRELEVLRFLADGLANKEIAFQLSLSPHTVKFHVAQILAKLDAASRAEAVTLGIRLGLIPL